LKKTSSILALLVLVILTTVGMAYGQGFDLFCPFISQPPAFERITEKTFCPPTTPLACWFERIPQPEPPDYGVLLLARAEKEAAEAKAAAQAEAAKNAVQQEKPPGTVSKTPEKKESSSTSQPVKKPEAEKPAASPPAQEPPATSEPPPTVSPLKPPAGTTATATEKKVFDLVNHARVAEGLKPLILDIDLLWLARLRSEDLVAHGGTLNHDTPTYGRTGEMLSDAGISYYGCGENLAKTTSAERAVERWLASDKGHRENMLSVNYTHTGVGVARLDSTFIIISQVFINKK
jgi:uncharacterized protein YkwD